MGSKSATTADQVARVVIVVGVLVVLVVVVVAPVGLPLTESDRRNENEIKHKGQVE